MQCFYVILNLDQIKMRQLILTKILEFLALGKVVISNYFEDYKSYNDELIFMPEKNHTSDQYIKNLSLLLMIYINLIITTSSKRGVTMLKNISYEISKKSLLNKVVNYL